MSDADLLLSKFVELCEVFGATERATHEGPCDPLVPQRFFSVIWDRPGAPWTNISPLEDFGEIQRLLQSEDGKIWHKPYGSAVVERRLPYEDEQKTLVLLREIKDIADRSNLWVTMTDPVTGSWSFKWVRNPPGVKIPAPSPLATVPLNKYREWYLSQRKTWRDENMDLKTVLAEALAAAASMRNEDQDDGVIKMSTTDARPEQVDMQLCSRCARTMTLSDRLDPQGDTRVVASCESCKTHVMRIDLSTVEPSLDPIYEELLDRIAEEFPPRPLRS